MIGFLVNDYVGTVFGISHASLELRLFPNLPTYTPKYSSIYPIYNPNIYPIIL